MKKSVLIAAGVASVLALAGCASPATPNPTVTVTVNPSPASNGANATGVNYKIDGGLITRLITDSVIAAAGVTETAQCPGSNGTIEMKEGDTINCAYESSDGKNAMVDVTLNKGGTLTTVWKWGTQKSATPTPSATK